MVKARHPPAFFNVSAESAVVIRRRPPNVKAGPFVYYISAVICKSFYGAFNLAEKHVKVMAFYLNHVFRFRCLNFSISPSDSFDLAALTGSLICEQATHGRFLPIEYLFQPEAEINHILAAPKVFPLKGMVTFALVRWNVYIFQQSAFDNFTSRVKAQKPWRWLSPIISYLFAILTLPFITSTSSAFTGWMTFL